MKVFSLYLRTIWIIMEMGILIFCQVMVTIVVAENDTPIRASDRKIEPCNLSTTAPLVINRVTDQVDLAKKANHCLTSPTLML